MHPFEKFAEKIINFKFFLILLFFVALSYFYLDKQIAYFLAGYRDTTFIHINQFLTKFGYGLYYIIVLLVAYLFSFFILKKKTLANGFLFILLAVVLSGLICDALKILLGRARPSELFSHGLYGFYFFQIRANMWSFPSGHSTTITALILPLIILFPRYWIGLIIILLVISFTRVFIAAHFLSDTLAGMYLAITTVYFLFKYFQKKGWLAFK